MPVDGPVIGTSEQLLILEVAGMMVLTWGGVVVVRVPTVVLLSTGGFGCTRRIPGSVLSASSVLTVRLHRSTHMSRLFL